MPTVNNSELSDAARIWIYGIERALSAEEVLVLDEHMSRFAIGWSSHDRPITTAWQVVHDRFLIIAVDETIVGVSGCSIDNMVRYIKDVEMIMGLNLLGTGGQVFYRDSSALIHCVDRLSFTDLAKKGIVNQETIVFNNVIATLGEFRNGRWEVPMRKSWHIDVFGRALVDA